MKHTFTLLILCICVQAWSQTQIPIPLPGHSSTFTGNVRGYWFTAPTCFTITGVEVPTDASTGDQSIALLRLNTAPPLYSNTTNDFDTLFVTQNNPNPGIFPLNIVVNQGDVIGLLGCRATANSYATAGFTSNINGFPITLGRLGMQFPLTTTLPQQIWTENGGSISRVNLYYDTNLVYIPSYTNVGPTYSFNDGSDTLYTTSFSVWNYGDGSPLDTHHLPTHTYSFNGTYNVCSYINGACGIDTVCQSVTVCHYPIAAGYTSTATGLSASFTDTSYNATSWSWDFGDGNTSTVQNPTHVYNNIGWYNISLIASDINCGGLNDTITDSILVCVAPATGFTSLPGSNGQVSFTDTSVYAQSWAWDFGDGNTSTAQSPVHNYSASGWYNITLITSNMCGADTIYDSVLACIPSLAGFTSLTGSNGLVTFTDTSLQATSWSWDFGDGNTSAVQSPINNYSNTGWYNITLITSNLCGLGDTIYDSVLACVSPVAGFSVNANELSVSFTDTSTQAISWSWDFGDGNTSMQQNPTHIYGANGDYMVCLTAVNLCGDSTEICDTLAVFTTLGTGEETLSAGWDVFPNPSSGISTIRLNNSVADEGSLYLTDYTGKKVLLVYNGKFTEGEMQFMLNTGELASGVYLLVWETAGWQKNLKLVVH